jgi:nitrite reductase (cytochrome c-552)
MAVENVSVKKALWLWAVAFVLTGLVGAGIAALLLDINGKKNQGRQYPLMLNKVTDENVDFEVWGKNFPSHLEAYKSMAQNNTPTEFGGSLPYSKLLRFTAMTSLWAGYPFSLDFNEERSHFYSEIDQRDTKRNNKEWLNTHGMPKFAGQPGACMNCHSGWTPGLIRELGWEKFNKTPYWDLVAKIEKAHGGDIHGAKMGSTCADCHSPDDMSLRVTRPAYINAMVARGYEADAAHGLKATRQEMRSHVCQQCHVEYYFKGSDKLLTFPWTKWPKDQGLRIEMMEAYYDEARQATNGFQSDWVHKDTGAAMLKMQHPETELSSSGIHARSNVSCADCHMPYKREGAIKITDHNITSPLQHINASCQTCHPESESDLRLRVQRIQRSTAWSLKQAEGAILALIVDIKAAKGALLKMPELVNAGTDEEREALLAGHLGGARELHRRASMRWDFISSENSMGFHSPQEAARVLQGAGDLARQGQLVLQAALQKAGIAGFANTVAGKFPDSGTPISEREDPVVGSSPPAQLDAVDRTVDRVEF